MNNAESLSEEQYYIKACRYIYKNDTENLLHLIELNKNFNLFKENKPYQKNDFDPNFSVGSNSDNEQLLSVCLKSKINYFTAIKGAIYGRQLKGLEKLLSADFNIKEEAAQDIFGYLKNQGRISYNIQINEKMYSLIFDKFKTLTSADFLFNILLQNKKMEMALELESKIDPNYVTGPYKNHFLHDYVFYNTESQDNLDYLEKATDIYMGKKNYNSNTENSFGNNVFQFMIGKGKFKFANLFLEKIKEHKVIFDINSKNQKGHTAIHILFYKNGYVLNQFKLNKADLDLNIKTLIDNLFKFGCNFEIKSGKKSMGKSSLELGEKKYKNSEFFVLLETNILNNKLKFQENTTIHINKI